MVMCKETVLGEATDFFYRSIITRNSSRNDILDIEDGFVGKGSWCYTTGWDSKCSDLLRSKYPDNPVSYEACKTQEKPIEGYYCIYDGESAGKH